MAPSRSRFSGDSRAESGAAPGRRDAVEMLGLRLAPQVAELLANFKRPVRVTAGPPEPRDQGHRGSMVGIGLGKFQRGNVAFSQVQFPQVSPELLDRPAREPEHPSQAAVQSDGQQVPLGVVPCLAAHQLSRKPGVQRLHADFP